MLSFLFGKRDTAPEPTPETQRQTLLRAVGEVNGIVAGLDPKPRISFDPATGAIAFELPDQFPDEAAALPAPTATAPTEAPRGEERATPAQAASGGQQSQTGG